MLRSAVARSLEFSLEDKKVSLDALARETGERRLVLLLDNCICSTEPRVSSRSYCAFDLIPPSDRADQLKAEFSWPMAMLEAIRAHATVRGAVPTGLRN